MFLILRSSFGSSHPTRPPFPPIQALTPLPTPLSSSSFYTHLTSYPSQTNSILFLPPLFLLFHFLFISTTSFIITSLPPTPLSLFHFPLLPLLLSTLPFRGQQPSCPKYKLAFNFTSVIPLRSRKEHGASNRGRGPRYPCPLPCARAPPSVGVHSVYYDDRPRVFIWCT